MRWLILGGGNQRMLVPLVRHTAQMYRHRALRQADWLRFFLPALMTAGIGGTVTLLYGLSLLIPVTQLYEHLSH